MHGSDVFISLLPHQVNPEAVRAREESREPGRMGEAGKDWTENVYKVSRGLGLQRETSVSWRALA